MARMAGAVWRPIPVASTRPKRRKGRGVCYHVAVSEASSLHGYFSTSTSDSHFYVAKDGRIEQYVDTELVAYANAGGNSTLLSVETQGGLTNTETEPWTDAQLTSLAKIAKWAHDTEGVPLRLMQNSLPTEKGLGWHKLGVNPWVVSGGEVWSSAYGKVCPGLAKIKQMPEVLRRAQGGASVAGEKPAPKPVEDDMPTAQEIAAAVWKYDAGGADGTQRAADLLSQVNTALMAKVERVDGGAAGPAEGDVVPVSRAKMIEYVDARTRRLEAGLAEVLELLRAQQTPPTA